MKRPLPWDCPQCNGHGGAFSLWASNKEREAFRDLLCVFHYQKEARAKEDWAETSKRIRDMTDEEIDAALKKGERSAKALSKDLRRTLTPPSRDRKWKLW